MRDNSITSVVVLDHQPIIRAAFNIIALIRPDLSFVCTDSESELLQTVRSGYDVVVIDPNPAGEGIDASLIQRIKIANPAIRIVIYTAVEQLPELTDALKAGADSYIHKMTSCALMLDGVKRTASGEHLWLSARPERSALGNGFLYSAPSWSRMTKREAEIFAMLVQRFTNEEIADRLRLANQTVKNHVSSVLRKVGARNRNELLRRAVEGWPAA